MKRELETGRNGWERDNAGNSNIRLRAKHPPGYQSIRVGGGNGEDQQAYRANYPFPDSVSSGGGVHRYIGIERPAKWFCPNCKSESTTEPGVVEVPRRCAACSAELERVS